MLCPLPGVINIHCNVLASHSIMYQHIKPSLKSALRSEADHDTMKELAALESMTTQRQHPSLKNCGKKSIIISFDNQHSSTFHAPWLWHNDSRNIITPSGQRKQSPGYWNSEAAIVHASIRHGSDIDIVSLRQEVCQNADFITKSGAIHPINTCIAVDDTTRSCKIKNDGDVGVNAELSELMLVITWNRPIHKDADIENENCNSIYNLLWLKQWAYDSFATTASRLKREVSDEHTFLYKYRQIKDREGIAAVREMHDGLVSVDFRHVESDNIDNHSLRFFDGIFLDGAAIVTNAPCISSQQTPEDIVSKVGRSISGGSLSHGALYGDTFHVQSAPDAINIAYTSAVLCPHQDLAYYESTPGFQLLHCASMTRNVLGGESILIDCMAAAHRFRQLAPDLFEILVKCPATFVKSRVGAYMTFTAPHISLHNDGCCDLNDMDREIVNVHWAPPFEGPLQIHPDRVEDYFKAYAAFELMLDNSKCPKACSEASSIGLDLAICLSEYARDYTWEYRLKPGEILVFNNTRMLHGRRKFEIIKGKNDGGGSFERHLIGAYTNIDDSLNRYRVLLNESGLASGGRVIPNVGNGTRSVLPTV